MTRRVVVLALAALTLTGCAVYNRGMTDRELEALRVEVAALRAAAAARFEADTVTTHIAADTSSVAIGLRVATVRAIISSVAARYLDDVRLHLRPNVVVTESDDVRVGVGPLRVTAGSWHLAVTIQRVDALMRALPIDIAVTDSNRVDITVPVHVSEGTGDALIDFRWDAGTVTSVVCGDFTVREAFAGYVEPRTYRVRGHFALVGEAGGLVARPVVHDRIPVSPQPTEASWERVRQILRHQNRIFNCGIAISPAGMEKMLRELLTKGFRFSLPSSIIRPIPLPGSILNQVNVAGRWAAVAITPEPPLLTNEWLWLRARVNASAYGDAPIRVETR